MALASSEELAAWLRANADKKGTPDYQTVLRGFQEAIIKEGAVKPAAPTAKPESGFFPALRAGKEELMGGLAALAGRTGLMDVEAAQKEYEARQQKAKEVFAPTEAGWTESPVTKTLELLGGSLPYVAAPLAAGVGVATLPVTGTTATVLGLGAAGLASTAQFTATNLSRQLEEGKGKVKIADTDLGAAALAAVPQAALDTISLRMIPGIGRIFGRAGVELTEETAKKVVDQGLKKVAADYALATGKTMGVEGLTEAAQQVLERAQAGLNITDEAARKEYFDSFLGGAVLGGTLAPAGRYLERGSEQRKAKQVLQDVENKRAAEAQAAEEAKKKDPEYLLQLNTDYEAAKVRQQELDKAAKKPGKDAPPDVWETYKQARDEANTHKNQTLIPLGKEVSKNKAAIAQAVERRRVEGMTPMEYLLEQTRTAPATGPAPGERGMRTEEDTEIFPTIAAPAPENAYTYAEKQIALAKEIEYANERDADTAIPLYAKYLLENPAMASELVKGKKRLPGMSRAESNDILGEVKDGLERLGVAIGTERDAIEAEAAAKKATEERVKAETEALGRIAERSEFATGFMREKREDEKSRRIGEALRSPVDTQLDMFPEVRETVTKTGEGEPATRVQATPLTAEVQPRPRPTLEEGTQNLLGRIQESQQVSEEDKALAAQVQDNLPAYLNTARALQEEQQARVERERPGAAVRTVDPMQQLSDWLYNTVTGNADPQESARIRQILDVVQQGRQSETAQVLAPTRRTLTQEERQDLKGTTLAQRKKTLELAPTGETEQVVQQELEMPEPRAIQFATFKEFNNYLASAALADTRKAIGLIAPTVARVQKLVSKVKEKIQRLRADEQRLKQLQKNLEGKTAAERQAAEEIVAAAQLRVDISRSSFECYVESVIAAKDAARQKVADALAVRSKIAKQIEDNAKALTARVEGAIVSEKTGMPQGAMAAYESMQAAQKEFDAALSVWSTAEQKKTAVVQDMVTYSKWPFTGADFGPGSDTLKRYTLVKNALDMARKDLAAATLRLSSAKKRYRGTYAYAKTVPDIEFERFLTKQTELEAALEAQTKRVAELKRVKILSSDPAVNEYIQIRDAADIALNKALMENQGADVTEMIKRHMAPVQQKLSEISFGYLKGTPAQFAELKAAQDALAEAKALKIESASELMTAQQQIAALEKLAQEKATEANKLENKVKSVEQKAEARAQARIPKPVEGETQSEREARDAQTRREEQALLERMEEPTQDGKPIPRTLVSFEKRRAKESRVETTGKMAAVNAEISALEEVLSDEALRIAQEEQAPLETAAAKAQARERTSRRVTKFTTLPIGEYMTPEQIAKELEPRFKKAAKTFEAAKPGLTNEQRADAVKRLSELRKQLNEAVTASKEYYARVGNSLEKAQEEISKLRTELAGELLNKKELAKVNNVQKKQGDAAAQATRAELEAPKRAKREKRLEVVLKEQEARIIEFNKNASGSRLIPLQTKAEKAAAREELNRQLGTAPQTEETAEEIANIVQGQSSKRAIGPMTREGTQPTRTMRTGSEESRAGETTTPGRVYYSGKLKKIVGERPIQEARGVKQRDIPITKAEQAAANKEAEELRPVSKVASPELAKEAEKIIKKTEKATAELKEKQRRAAPEGKQRAARSIIAVEKIEQIEDDVDFEPEILPGVNQDVYFSRGTAANPSTTDSVRAELKEQFPDLGRVQIYDSVDALIKANPQYEGKIPADARGFVDTAGNKAFLIAENINQGQALSVLLHEVGVHIGMRETLGNQYNASINAVENWAKKDDGSLESRIAKAAQARVEKADTPASQQRDELIAYAAEEAVNAGVKPTETKSPIGRWLGQIMSMFRNALRKFGLASKDLTAQELVDMAYGAAKLQLNAQPTVITDTKAEPKVGELFFSKKVDYAPGMEQAGKVASTLIGKPKTAWQSAKENLFGLNFRTQFVDALAPIEAVASQMKDSLKASQMMYYLRMYGQRMNFTSQAVERGAPVVREIKRRDGRIERIIEATDGANIKDIVALLSTKEVKAAAGSADAANKLFTLYLAAIRAKRVGMDALNFGGKVTEAELNAAFNQIESNPVLKNAFGKARDLYNEYNRDLLKFAVQTGAISQDLATKLLSENDYVPFYRVRDGVAELVIGTETPIRVGNLKDSPHLQELIGGDEAIFNFLDSSVQNTAMLIDMSVRNLAVKNSMFELSELGLVSNPVKAGKKGPPTGAVTFKKDGVEYYVVPQKEKLEQYGVPADLLVKGLEGIPTMFPAFVRLFGVPSRFLRRVVVASPVYMARQLFRDSLASYIISGSNATPVFGALKQIGKVGPLEKRGITGGQVFTGMPEDVSRLLAEMQSGRPGWDKALTSLEALSMKSDALSRRAQYESYIAQGMSEMEATLLSLESMNFSKRGVSPTVHMATTLIPFMNAQIQSLDVLYKAFSGKMPFNDKIAIRDKMLTRGLLLAAMSLAYAAGMEDDETYKNALPDQKYNNWFVKVPGLEEAVKVPIPFELGYIFKALPEALYNSMTQERGAAEAKEAFTNILRNLIPGGSSFFIPQAVKPLIEVGMGKSFFTGRDLETAQEQAQMPGTRYRDNTSEAAKFIGEMTNVSPVKLESLISGYTGSMGLALLQSLNMVLPTSAPDKATKRLSDMPVVGTLFQPKDAGGIINDTYKQLEEATQAQASYKALINRGEFGKAQALLQTSLDEMSLNALATNYKSNMGKLTKAENMIRASSMSPDEKREALDRIRQAKIQIATAVRGVLEKRGLQASPA